MKILKIKPWAIKFQIGKQKYLLKERTEDYETSCALYKFDADELGRYSLEFVDYFYGSMPYVPRVKGQTYRDTDVALLAEQICARGAGKKIFGEAVSEEYAKKYERRQLMDKRDRLLHELIEVQMRLETL